MVFQLIVGGEDHIFQQFYFLIISRKRMTGPRAPVLQKLGDAIHHLSRRASKRRDQHCGFLTIIPDATHPDKAACVARRATSAVKGVHCRACGQTRNQLIDSPPRRRTQSQAWSCEWRRRQIIRRPRFQLFCSSASGRQYAVPPGNKLAASGQP